jgi:HPt (histidine-containing phosphotransfer) domain-containing protein
VVRNNGIVQISDPLAVLDRDQLREITLEDEGLMREILSALIADTSQQIQLLAEAVRDQDPGKCARLAHYSKGACANLGANRIAAGFKQIERSAKAGTLQECANLLESLRQEVDLLRDEPV